MWTLPLHLILWTYAFAESHWWEGPGIENSRVVYPFRTDQAGHVISPDVSTTGSPHVRDNEEAESGVRVVRSATDQTQGGYSSEYDDDTPKTSQQNTHRHSQDTHRTPHDTHRSSHDAQTSPDDTQTNSTHPEDDTLYIVINNADEELFLSLTPNTKLITPHTIIEWVLEDGRRIYKRPAQGCFYTGKLQSREGSLVAVSNCGGLTGYIQTSNTSYFIQPLKRPEDSEGGVGSSESGPQPHLIYAVQSVTSRLNLSLQQDQEFQAETTQKDLFQTQSEGESDHFQTHKHPEHKPVGKFHLTLTEPEHQHPHQLQTHTEHTAHRHSHTQTRGQIQTQERIRPDHHQHHHRFQDWLPEFSEGSRVEIGSSGLEDFQDSVSQPSVQDPWLPGRDTELPRHTQLERVGFQERTREEEETRVNNRHRELTQRIVKNRSSNTSRRRKRSPAIHPKFRRWQRPPKFAWNAGGFGSERRGRSAGISNTRLRSVVVTPDLQQSSERQREELEERRTGLEVAGSPREGLEERRRVLESLGERRRRPGDQIHVEERLEGWRGYVDAAVGLEQEGLEAGRRGLDAPDTGSGMADEDSSFDSGISGRLDEVVIHPHKGQMMMEELEVEDRRTERKKRKGRRNGCKKRRRDRLGEEGRNVEEGNKEEERGGGGGGEESCNDERKKKVSKEERRRMREERRNRRRQEREQSRRERERMKQEKRRRKKEERRRRRQECEEARRRREEEEGERGGGVEEVNREGGGRCKPKETEEERKRKRRRRKKRRKGRKNRRTNEVNPEETVVTPDTPQVSSRAVDPWEGQQWDGYSPDLWSGQVAPGSSGLHEVTAPPPLPQPDPPKWMELVVAADHTLIHFHGADQVEKYVFTLFNIVSAIYQDPSLEANLDLVMLRIIFYNDTKHSQIREGQAKQSLEAVNRWSERLYHASPAALRHDLAVWLTRTDLGGPSGYAPVAGVCQPARSCTLNRDEGLTSAFIIAHEMAHVLGLSHDGDSGAGNTCQDEGFQGSVMAPLVAATFNRFHWSTCSRLEYHAKARNWDCLMNQPQSTNATPVHSTIQYQYSLDDQCRMEFGDGYGLCESLAGSDPCVHLWCSNSSTPFHCKTKKGPPLEGTVCGEQKWCHQGFCVPMSSDGGGGDGTRRRAGGGGGRRDPPVRHNPRPGGWGEWSAWGPCSRTCGVGVAFRIRACDNPTPAWGGRSCRGKREDWRVCGHGECSLPRRDPKAIQCSRLSNIVPLDPRRASLTWLPYEPKRRKKKCRISCYSHDTNEVYIGREFVVDGTPCSYDKPDDICVQGKCVSLGCDGVVGSRAKADQCGVCEGDGSTCVTHNYHYNSIPPQEYSLVATLPAGAHHIMVSEEAATSNFLALSSNTTKTSSSSSSYFLNGNRNQEPSKSFIGEGAKFVYSNHEERELLRANGPLLSPVSVMIHGTAAGETVRVTTSYLTQLRPEFHQWEVGPFTACSVTCGGGEQHQTLICRDRRTDRQVFHDRCHHLPRPPLNTTSCNTFGCEAKWVSGPWEHCSATCGPSGVQERMVFCVTLPEAGAGNWTSGIVDPQYCQPHPMPDTHRPCLHDPCPGHWMPREWSQCSASCGEGTEVREWECVGGGEDNEVTYTCAPHPKPHQARVCVGPPCPSDSKPCLRDSSSFCQLPVLHRYCQLQKYRDLCCHTCANVVY